MKKVYFYEAVVFVIEIKYVKFLKMSKIGITNILSWKLILWDVCILNISLMMKFSIFCKLNPTHDTFIGELYFIGELSWFDVSGRSDNEGFSSSVSTLNSSSKGSWSLRLEKIPSKVRLNSVISTSSWHWVWSIFWNLFIENWKPQTKSNDCLQTQENLKLYFF